MAQKAYDRELETIYQDEDYLNALKKVAPGIAKTVVEKGEKIPGLKVDWLSPKLESEWQGLSQSNNQSIKELIEKRDLFKNATNIKIKDISLISLNRSINELIPDKTSFAELLNKAPVLSKQMQQYHDRTKERDRGVSR